MRNLKQLPALICAGTWISPLTPAATNMEESLEPAHWASGFLGRAGHLVELAWMQARDDHGQQLGIVVTT